MVIEGTYFDGVNSKAIPAQLVLMINAVELRHAGGAEMLPLDTLEVDAPLGDTPRQITWPGNARFVTNDQRGADQLANAVPHTDRLRLVAWLEARTGVAVTALAVTIVAAVTFAVWGVPWMSSAVAFAAPDEVSAQLGDSTLSAIDQVLAPSELPEARQTELRTYFAEHGAVATTVFRKGGRIGANAFTLSASTVVMTDELVALADHREELLAVYLHELGHARLKHVERSILQNSAWVVLFTLLTGDFSGAGELILSLPVAIGQMAFSREFEREADRFAIDAMLGAGLDPARLADILEAMVEGASTEAAQAKEEQDADPQSRDTTATDQPAANGAEGDREREWADSLLDYFSTHPATSERLAYIRSAARAD